MLKIDYKSEATEGESVESTLITDVKVIRANTTSIDFEIIYSNPLVVSRNPKEPDQIILSFDQSLFKDPIDDFVVNDGEPLVIDLPR